MHFPLTHLDIVSAIRSRLLPSGHIDAMAFVQTFAWHSLVPKLRLRLLNVVVNPGEEELYLQFYKCVDNHSLAFNILIACIHCDDSYTSAIGGREST